MSANTGNKPLNFAISGLGYIFDRHLSAIEHIGGKLLMACDVNEKKQEKLDSDVLFFTDFNEMYEHERFADIDYVVVATPNYLHAEMAGKAISKGKDVLCEKPTVTSIKELGELQKHCPLFDKQIFTCLQLRHDPVLQVLKNNLQKKHGYSNVKLELFMSRDDTYFKGWKGDNSKSGGLLFNIGVHYFDLMCWFFGEPKEFKIDYLEVKEGAGTITFEKAHVDWIIDLTVNADFQRRMLKIDFNKINLTRILESRHTRVYEALKERKGVSLFDVEPVIKLCENMTNSYGV